MDVLNASPTRRSPVVRAISALLCALLLVATVVRANAAPTEMQAPENRVKAAFIYKFCDYIEWPAEAFSTPDSPLVIGVVEAGALADELARITAARTIHGRRVAVKKLRYNEPLSGLHVIFIGRADSRHLTSALEASKGAPALTVTESADGLRLGSMINFVIVADKVRFDVAPASAEANRLKISSRLLAVARTVVEPAP